MPALASPKIRISPPSPPLVPAFAIKVELPALETPINAVSPPEGTGDAAAVAGKDGVARGRKMLQDSSTAQRAADRATQIGIGAVGCARRIEELRAPADLSARRSSMIGKPSAGGARSVVEHRLAADRAAVVDEHAVGCGGAVVENGFAAVVVSERAIARCRGVEKSRAAAGASASAVAKGAITGRRAGLELRSAAERTSDRAAVVNKGALVGGRIGEKSRQTATGTVGCAAVVRKGGIFRCKNDYHGAAQ